MREKMNLLLAEIKGHYDPNVTMNIILNLVLGLIVILVKKNILSEEDIDYMTIAVKQSKEQS